MEEASASEIILSLMAHCAPAVVVADPIASAMMRAFEVNMSVDSKEFSGAKVQAISWLYNPYISVISFNHRRLFWPNRTLSRLKIPKYGDWPPEEKIVPLQIVSILLRVKRG